jgi:hypothetical protein
MPSAGACDSVEDPNLDAREAHPQWLASADDLLLVRATRRPADDPKRLHFDLWRVPGHKRLARDVDGLLLTAEASAQRLRVTLPDGLRHGAAYVVTVPLGPQLRMRLGALDAQARMLAGEAPRVSAARPVTRAALLHLRALQALDGAQAGASQRDIAQVLFGLEAIVRRWQADGELRAQVRHLLRRARAYRDGGYLALAGVQRSPANADGDAPGDEPVR